MLPGIFVYPNVPNAEFNKGTSESIVNPSPAAIVFVTSKVITWPFGRGIVTESVSSWVIAKLPQLIHPILLALGPELGFAYDKDNWSSAIKKFLYIKISILIYEIIV